MKNTILKFSLFILTLLVAFFSWLAVDQAINNPQASDWMIPIIWFSLFYITFSLSAVLIKEKYLVNLETFLALALSLIFMPNFKHLIIIMLGFLFMLLAVGKIKKDLELNIKIDLWKTIHMGSALIIFSLGLVITSQYYFNVRNSGAEKLIPKFEMQGLTSTLTSKMLTNFYPEFKKLDNDEMTVDQLLLEAQKEEFEQEVGTKGKVNSKAEQNLILEQGRKQLEQMTGSKITGQEKVADLFSETINNKINSFIVPSMDSNKDLPIVPVVMAIFLFITVISLGSFLRPFWALIAKIIFIILVKLKVITINKVQKEVEVLG